MRARLPLVALATIFPVRSAAATTLTAGHPVLGSPAATSPGLPSYGSSDPTDSE